MKRTSNSLKVLSLAMSLAALFASSAAVQAFAGQRSLQAKTVTIWTKFNDQNPQNTQDQWLADALKEYTSATGVTVDSVTQPYDQINSKLNIAVRAGGSVPDV